MKGEKPVLNQAQPPGISPLDVIPDVGVDHNVNISTTSTLAVSVENFNDTNSHEPMTRTEYSLIAA